MNSPLNTRQMPVVEPPGDGNIYFEGSDPCRQLCFLGRDRHLQSVARQVSRLQILQGVVGDTCPKRGQKQLRRSHASVQPTTFNGLIAHYYVAARLRGELR